MCRRPRPHEVTPAAYRLFLSLLSLCFADIGTGSQSFYHHNRSVRISITATSHFSAQPARIVSGYVTRDIKHVGIIDLILAGMAMLHCPAGFHTVHFEDNLTDLQPGIAADMLETHSLE